MHNSIRPLLGFIIIFPVWGAGSRPVQIPDVPNAGGTYLPADRDVAVVCRPITVAPLRWVSKMVFGEADPVHCRLEFRGSDGSCRMMELDTPEGRVGGHQIWEYKVPCAPLAPPTTISVYTVSGCDADTLLAAARAYGNNMRREGENSADSELEPGKDAPYGYGAPEFCGTPTRSRCITSNSFPAWAVKQCGGTVATPEHAPGWFVAPTWYGPVDPERAARERLWR